MLWIYCVGWQLSILFCLLIHSYYCSDGTSIKVWGTAARHFSGGKTLKKSLVFTTSGGLKTLIMSSVLTTLYRKMPIFSWFHSKLGVKKKIGGMPPLPTSGTATGCLATFLVVLGEWTTTISHAAHNSSKTSTYRIWQLNCLPPSAMNFQQIINMNPSYILIKRSIRKLQHLQRKVVLLDLFRIAAMIFYFFY